MLMILSAWSDHVIHHQHPLYTAKIQKYAALLNYDQAYLDSIKRFNQFQIIYSQFWFKCQVAADAPFNDLLLHKKLFAYQDIDAEVATKCLLTLSRHPWYRVPDMGFLSLASDKVSMDEKRRIAQTILAQPDSVLSWLFSNQEATRSLPWLGRRWMDSN
jgi:hypothetical protein